MAWTRPKPRLDDDNRAFWTGGSNGALNIHRCGDCGAFTHPPREICRHCRSEAVAPFAVSGRAMVEGLTINHQRWMPGMEVPQVIARVRLEDAPGVYLTTNIINCAPEDVEVDDLVQVVFEEQDGIWFPLFEKTI